MFSLVKTTEKATWLSEKNNTQCRWNVRYEVRSISNFKERVPGVQREARRSHSLSLIFYQGWKKCLWLESLTAQWGTEAGCSQSNRFPSTLPRPCRSHLLDAAAHNEGRLVLPDVAHGTTCQPSVETPLQAYWEASFPDCSGLNRFDPYRLNVFEDLIHRKWHSE